MKTMRAKKILYLISLVAVILLPSKLLSQTSADALRYSFITPGGTARFVSMGGAFGALGADFSAIGYNPAGLGVYRSSEFTITPRFKNRSMMDQEPDLVSKTLELSPRYQTRNLRRRG